MSNVGNGPSLSVLTGNGTNRPPTWQLPAPPLGTITQHDVLVGGASNAIASITNGTTGQVLTAVTSSNPIWAANAAFNSVAIQTFTYTGSPQTYTPTAGMLYCIIEVLGGGGGGGGSPAITNMQTSVGGGGGAGEYARGVFTAATIGSSQVVTIGIGGGGNSGITGTSGGNSSVGSLITAIGGLGGPPSPSNPNVNIVGGLGGTGGTGGSFRSSGYNGGFGIGSLSVSLLIGGAGANSQYGSGGNSSSVGVGIAATAGFGAGGGGASQIGSVATAAQAGGAGSGGIVIITEYI